MEFSEKQYRSGHEGRQEMAKAVAEALLKDFAAADQATRQLESKVLYDDDIGYEAWVKLFGAALLHIIEDKGGANEPQAFCLIQVINACRRVPENQNTVPIFVERVWKLLEDLVETPTVLRLRELVNYHEAQFAEVVGDFRRAALCHARSGDQARARGDELSMALSQFSQAAATVRYYIAADDSDEASAALAVLMDGAEAVERAFGDRQDDEARRWLGLNLPWTVITLHFLAGDHISVFPEYVERLLDYSRDFPQFRAETFANVRVGEMVQLWVGCMDITQTGPIWHGVDAALRFYDDMNIPMSVDALGVAHVLLSMRGDIEAVQIAAHLEQVMNLPRSVLYIRTYARGLAERQGVDGLLN